MTSSLPPQNTSNYDWKVLWVLYSQVWKPHWVKLPGFEPVDKEGPLYIQPSGFKGSILLNARYNGVPTGYWHQALACFMMHLVGHCENSKLD